MFNSLLFRSAVAAARQAGDRTPPVMSATWVPLLAAAVLMSFTRLSSYFGVSSILTTSWRLEGSKPFSLKLFL